MRKVLIGGAAALVVVAGGGYALWLWGAGEVEAAMDAEVAAMAEDGLRVGWSSRSIGGFPTGYVVRLEGVTLQDAGGAWSLSTYSTDSRVSFGALDRIETTTDSVATLTLAPRPGVAPMVLDVLSDGLTIVNSAEGLDATARRLTITAPPQGGVRPALTLENPDATITDGPDGGTRARLTADAATQVAPGALPDGRTVAIESVWRGLTAEVAAQGAVSLPAYASGDSVLTVAVTAEGTGSVGAMGESTGEDVRIAARLGDGRATLEATARSGVYAIPLRGGQGMLSVGPGRAAFAVPLAAGPEPQPFSVELTFEDWRPDDAVWSVLDPAGERPREPMSAALSAGGAATLFVDLGADAGGRPPLRVETLSLDALRIEGLGISAEATAELRLRQDIPTPDGEISVEVRGWRDLLAILQRLGVIGGGQVGLATLLAEEYARPGADPAVFEAEIVLQDGVATINGRPVR